VLEPEDIFLDFFAGCGSSFDAIVRLNQADGGSRRIILIQLPEPTVVGSEAEKGGFTTISDICRERMRRVLSKLDSDLLSDEAPPIGFKSLKLSPSNFRQWRGDGIVSPEELGEQIEFFVRSEKDGANVDDVLYELLLKFGQDLTTPVESITVAGIRVFAIRDRQMLFVLEGFREPMIDAVLEMKPREVIALDSVFRDSDELKTNFDLQCRDAGVKFTCI
jgi:adenine-specific DNA-methyltransferase